jgi:hypothetical protein
MQFQIKTRGKYNSVQSYESMQIIIKIDLKRKSIHRTDDECDILP